MEQKFKLYNLYDIVCLHVLSFFFRSFLVLKLGCQLFLRLYFFVIYFIKILREMSKNKSIKKNHFSVKGTYLEVDISKFRFGAHNFYTNNRLTKSLRPHQINILESFASSLRQRGVRSTLLFFQFTWLASLTTGQRD